MRTLWQDIRYGFRMLKKRPGFTMIALVTLAIGIGANTIMFSIADLLLLLQPKHIKSIDKLALCRIKDGKFGAIYYSGYQTLRDSGLGFSDVMAQTGGSGGTTLVRGDSALQIQPLYVSANYFPFLGVTPALGRGFLPEEERVGSASVTVLSHDLWRRLGGNPKLVGEFRNINGVECQIIGVAPKGFTGAAMLGPDLWLPLGSYRAVSTWYRDRPPRANASVDQLYPWCDIVGRLKPGLDMAIAQAQLQSLVPQFQDRYPRQWTAHTSFSLRRPGRIEIDISEQQGRLMFSIVSVVLTTVSMVILIIACLNLANMLMVQGASRHREIAVRMALGGGRLRIIRQLFVESLLLALLGGALGVLLAFWGTQVLNVYVSGIPDDHMSRLRIGLNGRVLAGTLGVCAMATLLSGLRPALRLSKRDIAGEMKTSARSVLGALRRRHEGLSVVGQIALAVALVLCAALLTHSALEVARPDQRFTLTDKLVVQIDPLCFGHDKAQSVQACHDLADHLASLPAVKSLGMTPGLFYGGGGYIGIREHEPAAGGIAPRGPLVRKNARVEVGRDYLEAMEVPLLRGRFFSQLDSALEAEKVAIIDETVARKLRPDGDVLGCFIQWSVPLVRETIPDLYRVVGVVGNRPGVRDGEIYGQMYTPMKPDQLASHFYLHVANSKSVDIVRRQILDEARRVAPRIPILSVAALAEIQGDDNAVWLARFGAHLALTAGSAALFLAALGIYAIKGYMVASRTSEIGIRMALGATRGSIAGMVLRQGLVLTIVGLTVGLLAGLGVAKVAARLLYGVSPIDPVSIVVTVALLGAASLLASYLPARRAAKVDPMTALRCE